MLDGLLGRGSFNSKCKSLIKATRTRIDAIRRKRNATEKFLRKDIADLLADGLDNKAFGRVDGLIAELNCTSCYDFIDDACEIVLKHLSDMQQKSHCPEECQEAVASLMFAAARFSDLPELRDLREGFQHQYGDSLEHYVNQKLVQHASPEPPDVKKKLKLLQEIASEFTVKWNSYAIEQRITGKAAAKEVVKDKPTARATLNPAQPKESISKVHNDAPVVKNRAEKASRWTKAGEILSNDKHHGQSGTEAVAHIQNTDELFHAREFPIGFLNSPFVVKASHKADDKIVIPRRERPIDSHKSSKGRQISPPYVKARKSKHKVKQPEPLEDGDNSSTSTFNLGPQKDEPETDISHHTEEYYASEEASLHDPAPRRRPRRTHHEPSSTSMDEEEKVIDELLLLYSKKTLAGDKTVYIDDSESVRDGDSNRKGRVPPPSRSVSLPSDHSSSEHKKSFARTASFNEEASAPAKHVHPKLPDYDDIAARFAAMRRNKA